MRSWHSAAAYTYFWIALLCVLNVTCRTVVVQQGGQQLIKALNDSTVDTIVLSGSYSVATDFASSSPDPVHLQRNITIQGHPHQHEVRPTLDLAFRKAVVVLCSTCTVTMKNMVVRNSRRGSGMLLDFFVGDDDDAHGSAAVLLQDLYRHRLACSPGSDAAEVVLNTPRSTRLPSGASAKQQADLVNVTYEGVTHANSLHVIDFTADFPITHQEGRGHTATAHFGGYALGAHNVVYICDHLVERACLAEKPADACINELIDRILTGSAKKHTQGLHGPLLAAVIVPIVAAVAIVTAIIAWLVRRRVQQRQQQQHLAYHQDKLHPQGSGPGAHNPAPSSCAPPSDSCNVGDSASDMHSMHSKSEDGRRSLELAMQPGGKQHGWKLVSAATSDFVQPLVRPEAGVEFGNFLGAGSYGRVYRARWAGRDVACKVIQHDRSTLAAVKAEADLMLSLKHDNVVKAYHYSTYTYFAPAQSGRGGKHGKPRSHGSTPGHQRHDSSQSSGNSSAVPQNQPGTQTAVDARYTTDSSCSSSGQRVQLLQREQHVRDAQQPVLPQASQLEQQESVDVLVSHLSVDASVVSHGTSATAASPTAVTIKGFADADTRLDPELGKLQSTCPAGGQSATCAKDPAGLTLKAETWLVQEYCDMGTLGGLAGTWDIDDECDEQMLERLQLLRDAAAGLEALHANRIVHGDMNARNVLVSSSSNTPLGMCAKVADLGLARCLAHHATHRTTNSCGTMSHMAPELLRWGRLGPAVDVYAFGVMMWELYHSGRAAFDKLHYGQFFETIVLRKVRPCVPAGMPPDYALVMRQCWAADPADRPSVSVLKQCLEVMLVDRRQRVEAALAVAAAATAGAQDCGVPVHSSSDEEATSAQQPPTRGPVTLGPGVDVLPALQALLPRSHHGGASKAQSTSHAPCDASSERPVTAVSLLTHHVSPGNSSGPLSVISLSDLFPDNNQQTQQQPGTVLLTHEDKNVGNADSSKSGGAALLLRAIRTARRRPSAASSSIVVGSPAASDIESQLLDKDTSVHDGRSWFV